jgi:hypothetical protein
MSLAGVAFMATCSWLPHVVTRGGTELRFLSLVGLCLGALMVFLGFWMWIKYLKSE